MMTHRRLRRWPIPQRLDNRNQLWGEAGKEGRHVGRSHARLEVVEEGVVAYTFVAHRVGFFARERKGFVEPWLEQLELILVASFRPRLMGVRGHARQLFNQLARKLCLAIEIAAELSHVHGFGRFGVADKRRALYFAQ